MPHLHQQTLSLDHATFAQTLATTENLIIIQDLDGVCMALVNDPLTRTISPDYIAASQAFHPHFYVLTNGEHTGKRGVNRIIEQAMGADATVLQERESYLPGLAAGGVQWQERNGIVSHPGVSEAELAFLKQVPAQMEACLRAFFQKHPGSPELQKNLDSYIAATVLDNIASPTINLNSLYPAMAEDNETFNALQTELKSLLSSLLTQATTQGLDNSFFIHYAPNLGREASGDEIVWFSERQDDGTAESGTTDFQFMLRGAIKEAGVLALLNHYYFQRSGNYPLGASFNARQAPHAMEDLVDLVKANFDPALMPMMVGVGDTVTSQVQGGEVKRGGSDRNFLQLIQNLNAHFDSNNLTVYVDSSGGELKNRQPLQIETVDGVETVVKGPGDEADPLRLNVAFPGGHGQYCQVYAEAAAERMAAQR